MDNNEVKIEGIPKLFHQDAEGSEFKNCTFCSKALVEDTPYMIEKFIKANVEKQVKSTLFEYAICIDCSIKKMKAMSEESVANIQRYMKENVMSEVDANASANLNYEQKMEKCPVTGVNRAELEEYSIVGQFVGNKMVVNEFPFVINSTVGESMQDLLSVETKKEFDDFMDTITDIPPELRSLFKSKRPVLV